MRWIHQNQHVCMNLFLVSCRCFVSLSQPFMISHCHENRPLLLKGFWIPEISINAFEDFKKQRTPFQGHTKDSIEFPYLKKKRRIRYSVSICPRNPSSSSESCFPNSAQVRLAIIIPTNIWEETSSKPANHRSAKGSKCLTPKKNISCCNRCNTR